MIISIDDLKAVIEANNLDILIEYHLNLLNLVSRNGGDTLLQQACKHQSESCVEYLLDQEVDVDYQNHKGKTALHYAVDRQHLGIVRRLLEKKANPNLVTGDSGRSPVHHLLSNDEAQEINLEILELIFNAENFNPNLIDPSSGESILVKLIKLSDDQCTSESKSKLPHLIEQLIRRVMQSKEKVDISQALDACMGKKGCLCGDCRPSTSGKPEYLKMIIRIAGEHGVPLDLSGLLSNKKNLGVTIEILLETGIHETPPDTCSILESVFVRCNSDQISRVMKQVASNAALQAELDINRICPSERSAGFMGIRGPNNALEFLLICQQIGDEDKLKYLEILIHQLKAKVKPNSFEFLKLVDKEEPNLKVQLAIIGLLRSNGVILEQKLNQYSQSIHLALTISFGLARNTVDLIDGDPLEEMNPQTFILLEENGGIAWDLDNLVSYITQYSQGSNRYTKSIFFSESVKGDEPKEVDLKDQSIWSDQDFTNIKNHPSGLGKKISDYLDISQYTKYFCSEEIEFLNQSLSIFWAIGDYWDQTLKKILTKKEMSDWNSIKGNRSNTGMPNMSINPGLETKLYNLKARQIHLFRRYYIPLSEQKKKVLEEFTGGNLGRRNTMGTINGKDCVMCYGSSLNRACARINQLKPFVTSKPDEFDVSLLSNERLKEEITVDKVVTNGREQDYYSDREHDYDSEDDSSED